MAQNAYDTIRSKRYELVVEPLVLAVLDARHDLALGRLV
jgi:hypothetical protein